MKYTFVLCVYLFSYFYENVFEPHFEYLTICKIGFYKIKWLEKTIK